MIVDAVELGMLRQAARAGEDAGPPQYRRRAKKAGYSDMDPRLILMPGRT